MSILKFKLIEDIKVKFITEKEFVDDILFQQEIHSFQLKSEELIKTIAESKDTGEAEQKNFQHALFELEEAEKMLKLIN